MHILTKGYSFLEGAIAICIRTFGFEHFGKKCANSYILRRLDSQGQPPDVFYNFFGPLDTFYAQSCIHQRGTNAKRGGYKQAFSSCGGGFSVFQGK
ncbi:hypothetical protein SE16_08330 [Ardenticatena maritima]|uniref:Uncharacterized protein n=1 Tax=Ardenticatena maritima TaxID=872965 RepID=A0A0P6Y6S3_9CHLR|nr:hypothetical protein SE16_08330 [Ardenticatena maritima]